MIKPSNSKGGLYAFLSMATNNYINFQQGKDGKYRWIYEVHLLKNFAILREVYWAFGVTCVICFLLVGCIGLCSDGIDGFKSLIPSPTTLLIVIAAVIAVGFIGYFLYAAICGWKYCVRFTMDEKEIVHEQMPRNAEKAKLISTLTVLAGLMAKRPGTVGTGMLAARTTMVSTFSSVKKIKAVRKSNLIKVNETLSKNQVYVEDEYFDFVYQFICQHCPNAKIV